MCINNINILDVYSNFFSSNSSAFISIISLYLNITICVSLYFKLTKMLIENSIIKLKREMHNLKSINYENY